MGDGVRQARRPCPSDDRRPDLTSLRHVAPWLRRSVTSGSASAMARTRSSSRAVTETTLTHRAGNASRIARSGAGRRTALPGRPALLLASGDEDRDLAIGPLLVFGVRRIGGDGPLPPPRALFARDLTDSRVERLGAVLDDDLIGIGREVGVPDGVLGSPALRGHEGVLSVVLNPHQRDLAHGPTLVAAHRHDDHR